MQTDRQAGRQTDTKTCRQTGRKKELWNNENTRNYQLPCCQENCQVLPTAECVGGIGQKKCCQVMGDHSHGRLELFGGIERGGAKHLYEPPEKKLFDHFDHWTWASKVQVCLCVTCVLEHDCYLSCGPSRAFTDVGNAEAETVGATEWIILLQVVETRFTQITVGSHHIHLRRNGQVRH